MQTVEPGQCPRCGKVIPQQAIDVVLTQVIPHYILCPHNGCGQRIDVVGAAQPGGPLILRPVDVTPGDA